MCIGSAILKTLVNLGNLRKMGKIFLLGLKTSDFGRKRGFLGANLDLAGHYLALDGRVEPGQKKTLGYCDFW